MLLGALPGFILLKNKNGTNETIRVSEMGE
jgi:hypothetical protein